MILTLILALAVQGCLALGGPFLGALPNSNPWANSPLQGCCSLLTKTGSVWFSEAFFRWDTPNSWSLCFFQKEPAPDNDSGLVGHWATVDAPLEVPALKAPDLTGKEATLALWVEVPLKLDRAMGDLISHYNPITRRGYHLTLKSSSGVTSNQPSDRHLQFGIDDDRSTPWEDRGRPGNSILGFSMVVHEGSLFVGTCEAGKADAGKVYRYAGGKDWVDCGAPDKSNAVTAMAVFQGNLYVGTGRYRLAGSSLPESENTHPGGRVFRYDGEKRWTDCGQLPKTEAVGGLVVFRDQLYASSLYRPAGFFRYGGAQSWSELPLPQTSSPGQNGQPSSREATPRRVVSLCCYEGAIYAGSYDCGHVFRFDGKAWTDLGQLGENTQTYSFTQYEGHLHVGTWPSGKVYRYQGPGKWTDWGRLGEELEVMGMMIHNGRFIAGTLPAGKVYSHENGTTWKEMAQLDSTPGVRYRRVWTMAEHQGQLFASTLPSGKVFSFAAGKQIAQERTLSPGWHHIAAIKESDQLKLFVDGQLVAQSARFEANGFQMAKDVPLRIGHGIHGPLNGTMADVRIYQRALKAREIELLAQRKPSR